MTKQQQIELVDIDIKLLRWVSEIVADGSEIRSLAGRSARLGDGTSRNPKDRDILMEQRTKDLAGMIGQVRGFDLDEFLSDWEPQNEALPWAVGDGGWVKGEGKVQGPSVNLPGTPISQLPSGPSHEPVGAKGCLRHLKYCMFQTTFQCSRGLQ